MCVRRIVVGLSLAVLLAGCSSSEQSLEPGSTVGSDAPQHANQPESLALVDENSDQPLIEFDVSLPAGLTEADLPDGLPDRIALLNGWLQSFEPARNVGNLPLSSDFDRGHEIEFLVRTSDRREAETLCPIYADAMTVYAGSLEQPVQIWLSGWLPNEAGIFTDPGWDRVSCGESPSR